MRRLSHFLTLALTFPLFAQLTFDPANPPSSATPPTEQYNAYTGAFSHQKGPKTVLVILVQPSDGAAWTTPPAFATLDGQLNTSSQNYYNASYHQTWFGPKRQSGFDIPRLVVTPVLILPKTASQYLASFGTLQSDCLAAVRAQGGAWNGGNLDPNYYDRWVVTSNTKMISSTGLAYVGGRFAWTGGGVSGGVAEHEWGHNWGVFHANDWRVPTGEHPRSSLGTNGEYQDGWDLMGGNNAGTSFNPQFRENLGFLERSRGEALDVTTSGTYRIHDYVHPYRRQDAGLVRALVLPMSSFTDPLRVVLGFGHVAATDGGLGRSDWNRNAVTVHSKLSNGSNRIDTTPGSRQTGDANDSSIKIGRTYSEGANVNGTQMYGGFHVTPIARGRTSFNGVDHEWIDVVVNYQNAISNNQPPTASFSSPLYTNASPALPYTLTVTASDPNGDPLAYDWDFGDGSYSILNAATQTKTWTTAGVYLVTCTVTDMKGGVTVAQTWVNVGNVPFRSPENPAATLAGVDFRYFEGVYNNLPVFANLLPVKSGDLSTFSLAPRNRNDNFAFLYEAYLNVPTTDVYTFYTHSDDGARLYIGDTLVVDNDGLKASALESSGNIALNAGVHRIRVEFFHRDGAETLNVSWSTLSSPKAPIPTAALHRTDWGGNLPPTVAITAPADGEVTIVGSSIEIQADATDSDGISRVAFFAGTAYLGQATSAPYAIVWPDVAAGSHALTAVAYDSSGRFSVSATNILHVESPPIRDMIGINFVDKAGAGGTLGFNQLAGAFYTQPNWNNAPKGTYAATPAWNATVTDLIDQTGAATTAWTRYRSRTHDNFGDGSSSADTSTANGRLLRGGLMVRNDSRSPEVEVYNIPYLEYDVYVYLDVLETNAGDRTAAEYVLTPGGQAPLPSIWARNSRTAGDGIGDYPTYDTWVGFKEATAASSSAPEAQQLGNYVVFRGVQTGSFHLIAKRVSSVSINAVQIVSRDPSAPRVALLTGGRSLAVAEGGTPDSYAVVLAYPPTHDVTVNLAPGPQLSLDRSSLLFTPQNWNLPQSVIVSAIDDAVLEGPHTGTITHTVSAGGNYAGLPAPPLTVDISDNDQPMVTVHASGTLREGSAGTASFVFIRSGLRSLAAPTTVSFQMSGNAAFSGDYTFSGASVSFNTGTGAGSVVIPAGQTQTVLTVAQVNNSIAEFGEQAVLTLLPGTGYTPVDPLSAVIFIADDEAPDYLTEIFNSSSYGSRAWDLNNRAITFTPSGGSYTVAVDPITAFPSGTSGFTSFSKTAMTSGTASSGWWAHTLSATFTFYGISYSQIFVNTEGAITFNSGSTSTGFASTLFGNTLPKIAPYWGNLDPNTSGNVQHLRITDGTNSRTVIFYNAVRISGTTSNASFQAELFDDGRIRFSYVSVPAHSNTFVVGLATGVSTTMPSSPYSETSSPRPFRPSDFTLYPPSGFPHRAPQFVTQPPVSATSGQSYSYAMGAADPDPGQTLTLTAPVKPAWLAFTDHGNGMATLSGTPPSSGSFPVTLLVSDGALSSTQSFTLLVVPGPGNTSPVFTSTPPAAALLGTAYSYAITTVDADGHAIALSALQRPSWLTLTDHGNGTGTLAGIAPAGASEENVVTLLASDGIASIIQSFTVVFTQPPAITLLRPLGGIVQTPALEQDLDLIATIDPRGESISLQWSQVTGPGNATFDTPNAASTRVRFDADGLYILELAADNGFGIATTRVYVFANTPASNVIAHGLQGYWQLNETSGTEFADASGNNRSASSATASTQPTVGVDGYADRALDFSGVNNQFALVDYAQPVAFTASAWIRSDLIPSAGARNIFAFMSNTTSRARLQLNTGESRLRFYSNYQTAGEWRVEYDIPMQEWVHVAVSYDRSSVNNHPVAYINGQPVAVTRLSAPSGTNNLPNLFRIGGGTSWLGRIDDVRLYDRIVPPADIPLLLSVGAINLAPRVALGADVAAAPSQTLELPAEVTDDGLPAFPGELDILWTQESGPDSPGFAAPSLPGSTFTTASVTGNHLLRLSADDGAARSSAILVVSVTTVAMADSNSNGVDDAWEMEIFDNLIDAPVNIGGVDYTRREVYVWGLAHPLTQVFAMDGLSFPTVSNRRYQLQFRASLTGGEWQDLGAVIQGDGNDRSIPSPLPGFYRVEVLLPE